MAAAPAQRVPLDTFLAGLPVDAADQIRDVVTVMVRNEEAAVELRGVEMELRPFFITAIVSFTVAMVFLMFFSKPGGFLDRVDGAWPILTAALGFLPGLLAYYAVRIRKRSQADVENFDLNKEYFLPHGAIYFPSDSGADEQMVTLVEAQEPVQRSKWDKLKPGTMW